MNPVEHHLERIRALDKGGQRKTVLVIGAGMAGLSAAHELEQLGHCVELVESNDRVGGRVLTHRFSDGTYNELGAMRIPAIHLYVRHYIAQLGLKLRKFISSHGNLECYYDIRDVQTRMKDAKLNLYPQLNLSTHEASLPVAPAILDEHFNSLVESLTDEEVRELAEGEITSDRLRSLDKVSLGEFFDRRAGNDAKELIGTTTGLEPWWHRAVTVFLREQILEPWNGLEEIVGGFDLLPKGLAARLKCKIRFQHRVTSISRTGKTVTVEVDTPSGSEQLHCDYLLCCIPFSTLRQVNISPAFSTEKMDAIRNLSYASATKVLLHCRERFWETHYGIYGGASQSDQSIRATYYPSNNVAVGLHTKERTWWGGQTLSKLKKGADDISKSPGVLVGTYSWDQDARRIGAMPGRRTADPPGTISPRAQSVVGMIKRFHPDIDKYVDDEASMFWDENPHAAGAYLFLEPGERSTVFLAAGKPEGNVFFAGEHTSLDHAWMEGAVSSAMRAVEEIVQA